MTRASVSRSSPFSKPNFSPFLSLIVILCVLGGKCPGVHGAIAQATPPELFNGVDVISPPTESTEVLKCWVGTSNPKASDGYPPLLTECSLGEFEGAICQVTYVANLNLYSMTCTLRSICQRLLNDLETGVSFFDNVQCCDDRNGCNADPNMPSAASQTSIPPFYSVGILFATATLLMDVSIFR